MITGVDPSGPFRWKKSDVIIDVISDVGGGKQENLVCVLDADSAQVES